MPCPCTGGRLLRLDPAVTMLRLSDQPEVKDFWQLPLLNMPPEFFIRTALPTLMHPRRFQPRDDGGEAGLQVIERGSFHAGFFPHQRGRQRMTSSFHNTRWTLVLRASGGGDEAQAALSELCGGSYEPVVAFLRRSGRGEDDAREAAHAFFAEVLEWGVQKSPKRPTAFPAYLEGLSRRAHLMRKQGLKGRKIIAQG